MARALGPRNWRDKKNKSLEHAFTMMDIAGGMDDFTVDRDPEFDYLKKAEDLFFNANQLRAEALLKGPNIVPGRTMKPKVNTVRLNDLVFNPGSKQKFQNRPTRPRPKAPRQRQRQRPNNRLNAFIQAIAGQESGGNYSAVNPDSGAAGKYQIMPANFAGQGGWDMDAIGRDISMQFYLNHPKVQERIARHKLREYFKQYGPRGAASAWYSGDPNKYKNTSPQGGYPSIASYVEQIMKRMG